MTDDRIRVFWVDDAGDHAQVMYRSQFEDWYHAHKPVQRMVIEGARHGD